MELGVLEEEIHPEARLLDLMVDEDATFWFIPAVEAKLRNTPDRAQWEQVVTVRDAIDLVARSNLSE